MDVQKSTEDMCKETIIASLERLDGFAIRWLKRVVVGLVGSGIVETQKIVRDEFETFIRGWKDPKDLTSTIAEGFASPEVYVLFNDGRTGVGYFSNDYIRSRWLTSIDFGTGEELMCLNRAWSGLRVVGWKERDNK